MLTKAQRANRKKLIIMAVLVLLAVAAYMAVDVNFSNARLFQYSISCCTAPVAFASCPMTGRANGFPGKPAGFAAG